MCNTDKVFDAVEVAGRNVMSTTSVVTTGLVTDRYSPRSKYSNAQNVMYYSIWFFLVFHLC